ncbi:Murein DD-endopeptidase MepM and murein hydrolase activator NlpD, contain LysM domain [Chryseobacterium ureilyticum]|uniref:Murein DD-endopeptidase MepM and murein hydrolase activator NlpD, contain LysM domain n=1 Tax=Chryseobacterium ureilyticum TaxID=373668 RepID=A0A1N7KN94_9FLAO|nr:M23 family metallopeptidase [Chryseobacterium ureilyticum]SIS63073.1 Murein DD-endopeptidase MepM and murein hydrolase activator NlpD, contain LysM domain [Chryseobacterium ureilyticum]
MKKILLLFVVLQSLILFSQKNIKVYHEKKGDTLSLYMDNQEAYPMSLVFSGFPEVENMKTSEVFRTTQIIAARSSKNRIAYFIIDDKTKGWKVKKIPDYVMYTGDITLKNYDKEYKYDLPFKAGKSFNIDQGYNGSFSHQNENSLDITMPVGTEVVAARDGIVTDFVSTNSKGCPTRACIDKANYITILHPDGTFAQYYHLKQDGVKVNIGDQVKKGEVIALSGNTGWSKGPHLHFVCYLPRVEKDNYRETIKTIFKIGNGAKTEYLVEKKRYSKDY